MTFLSFPIRDEAQHEDHLIELRCDNAGFEVSFPGDYADSICADPAERTNSFDNSYEAQYAAALARRLTTSMLKSLGGRHV